MRIIIVGINHAPELIGIGPYTAQFAAFLARAGHDVTVVTGKPYYPEWRVHADFAGLGWRRSVEERVAVWRCPLYVPAKPSGARRMLHYLSFAAAALVPLLAIAVRRRPDLVIAVAPSLVTAPLARAIARLVGARTWLHVQDFEVEAAFATGLLSPAKRSGRIARRFEAWAMSGFSRYSSISPQMCDKLAAMTRSGPVVEFRNWSDIDEIRPATGASMFRGKWNIETPHVALYSGNLANKQGIGILADAARLLQARKDLTFVICGDGSERVQFCQSVAGLPNVQVHPLQPRGDLQELLSLATVHLLPQLEGAADLVLPSKLTNMLASGRPVVATAAAGTGLAGEVEGCGIVTPPGDAAGLAKAIEQIIDDDALRGALGLAARQRAEERWARQAILTRIEGELRRCVEAKHRDPGAVEEPDGQGVYGVSRRDR